MKQKKFLKKYGNCFVKLHGLPLTENCDLNFVGITSKKRSILVEISGYLSNITVPIYVDTNYSLNYIIDNFRDFDIEIGVFEDTPVLLYIPYEP